MVAHRPCPLRPRRYDDPFVRAYHLFLRDSLAAGNDAVERQRLFPEMRYAGEAHKLFFAADIEQRHVVEARLLTSETFAEIAARFATEAPVIDCFEKLFFNVRDRLTNTDWIVKVIKGPEDHTPSRDGSPTAAERAHIYKLFGFFGGPKVLDAVVIACLSPNGRPQQNEDASAWFDEATPRRRAIAGGDGCQRVRRRRAECYATFETGPAYEARQVGGDGSQPIACNRLREDAPGAPTLRWRVLRLETVVGLKRIPRDKRGYRGHAAPANT